MITSFNTISKGRGRMRNAVFLTLFTALTAGAQERTITLNEAVSLGIRNSKTLRLSQARIEEAVSRYQQAKDEILPTGSASIAYNRAEIPANYLSLGPNTGIHLPSSANAYLGIASLNETLYAGGRYHYAQQSTELLTRVARLDAERDKDEITYTVISSFYNLYKVLQSIKVADQNLSTLDQQIHQADRFFQQGLVTKNDVLRFQLQRANIELNRVDLESNRKVINFDLDILLGLPESTVLHIDQFNEAAHAVAPLSSYLDTAVANRKELQQLQLQSKVSETNIKTIRANQLPTVAASVGGYYVDVAANPLPKYGSYITPLTAGLTFAWNFSSLWTNKNKVAEARIQQEQVGINQQISLDRVRNEVNRNYQAYLAALEKVKLLQVAIEQAQENSNILESKYRSNISSATDRADAETLLYQAQTNLELANADAGLAYYTLIKSTGTLNK